MDNLVCTSDMERSKHNFFMQHISSYQKFNYVDTNVILYIFRMNAMSFYGLKTLLLKMHKKDMNNMSIVFDKAIERICGRNSYDSYHGCLEYAHLQNCKHFIAGQFICFNQRLFTSKNPSPLIHKQYLTYNSVFRKRLERFFSGNYPLNNVLITLCIQY